MCSAKDNALDKGIANKLTSALDEALLLLKYLRKQCKELHLSLNINYNQYVEANGRITKRQTELSIEMVKFVRKILKHNVKTRY